MEAIWLLVILACPLVMGGMMFLMTRGMRRGDEPRDRAHRQSR